MRQSTTSIRGETHNSDADEYDACAYLNGDVDCDEHRIVDFCCGAHGKEDGPDDDANDYWNALSPHGNEDDVRATNPKLTPSELFLLMSGRRFGPAADHFGLNPRPTSTAGPNCKHLPLNWIGPSPKVPLETGGMTVS